MQLNDIVKLDTEKFLKDRFPDKKFPSLLVKLIRYMICEKQINGLYSDAQGKKNVEFATSCMKSMNVTCQVVGEENFPTNGEKLIFASNHPQGGIEAICIAHVLGTRYNGKIKFYANEFLQAVEPLKELFLPIYRKRHLQTRDSVEAINEFYKSENQLITFPAGVTSFKKNGVIIDHPWRKSFIKASVQYQRDVVPMYFKARNSHFFYFLENFRKRIHFPVNFEVALFAKEIFKQQGKNLTLYVGKPIPWQTFDRSKSLEEWTEYVRQKVYELPR